MREADRGGLGKLRDRVEEALTDLLDRETTGLPAGVGDAVRHAVLSPGKRVRPQLLLAAYEASGGPATEGASVAELSCSVELVHAFSLVHDDLPCMDDDVLRRGRPALHVRFGVPVAVCAGAALMPLAVGTVWRSGRALGLPEGRIRRLVRILTVAAGGGGMVGGQLRDLEAEGRTVSRKELEEIHRGKTGALMAASVTMGAVAAGAVAETVRRLRRFGHKLGLAFQAVDDILDVTGKPRELGKPGGRDEALGKATYPSLLGLEGARQASRELAAAARAELRGLTGAHTLSELTDLVVERSR